MDKKDIKIDETQKNDQDISPGECIGNWLEDDESCQRCEIWEDCKKMTQEISSGKEA